MKILRQIKCAGYGQLIKDTKKKVRKKWVSPWLVNFWSIYKRTSNEEFDDCQAWIIAGSKMLKECWVLNKRMKSRKSGNSWTYHKGNRGGHGVNVLTADCQVGWQQNF